MNDIQNCYFLKSEAVSIAAGNKYFNEILFFFLISASCTLFTVSYTIP